MFVVKNSMRYIFFFIAVIFFFNRDVNGFTTLQQLHTHTSSLEEFPKSDNVDWIFPDFSTHYNSMQKGVFASISESLGLYRPDWSVNQFHSLLKKVTNFREQQGYTGRFVQKIQVQPGEKYIIWGDLHGAYHSLDRCLQYLHTNNIIDQDFTIADGYTFIFNGNAINRSAYSSETLTVLLTLMDRNPDKVVYLCGHHEDKQHWHDESFEQELQFKAKEYSGERIPFNTLLTRFFDTLPVALFLVESKASEQSVVQISGFYTEQIEDATDQLQAFLRDPGAEKSTIFKLYDKYEDKAPEGMNAKIHAYIRAENRFTSYRKTKGLIQLDDKDGIQVWSILSSPISAHRALYEFFYDAFGVLSITDSIETWTLQLVHRDVRQAASFIERKEQVIVSSRVAAQEKLMQKEEALSKDVLVLSDKKIIEKKEKDLSSLVIGSTLDVSKGTKNVGMQVKVGIDLWFVREKEAGKNIPRIIFKDDKYNDEQAAKNIEEFVAENISIILSPVGDMAMNSYLTAIAEKKILSLFPIAGAQEFRSSELSNIIHYRKGVAKEAEVLFAYAHEKTQLKRYAVFYQDDIFGKSALEGAVRIKNAVGIEDANWLELAYDRNDVNLVDQSALLQEFKPDGVFFLATTIAARGLIRQIGIEFFAGKMLFGLSTCTEDVFMNFAKEKGLSFVMTSVVPDPKTSELAIAQMFREDTKKANVTPDAIAFESYIAAAIFMDICKNIEGAISKDAIITYAQKYNNYNLHGLNLIFNPDTRELSDGIWLHTKDHGWKKVEI